MLKYDSYKINIKLNPIRKNFILHENLEIPVYSPTIESDDCIIFFTGGNGLISYELYTTLLNNMASKDMSVYIYDNKIENFNKFLNKVNSLHKNIIFLGHSSGCSTLLKKCNNKISKIILIDPVDSRINRLNNFNLKYVKNILTIKAEKAYNGKFLPFIPNFLQINVDDLNTNSNIKNLNFKNFGHCDLLEPLQSNIIHNYVSFICDGSSNRKISYLTNYIDYLSNIIYFYIKNIDDSLDFNNSNNITIDDIDNNVIFYN